MNYIKMTSLPSLAIGLIISILQPGCATTEKSPEPVEAPSHYTIEMGEPQNHIEPLPDYYPFYLNWYKGSELLRRQLKFRGWDFNNDGKVDYLEELDEDGRSLGHYFDFTLDGQIDAHSPAP